MYPNSRLWKTSENSGAELGCNDQLKEVRLALEEQCESITECAWVAAPFPNQSGLFDEPH
jgi:hypothetical protein